MNASLLFSGHTKLPSILQTEAAECGLACLAMIANFHGYHADLVTLRRSYALSLKGATLANLIHTANTLQLAARPLRVELDDLTKLKTPCILHWDMNHFVVLKHADRKRAVVHDPAYGVRTLSYAEASLHFTGVALELSPTADFVAKKPEPTVRLRALMGRVSGLKRALAQILILALALEIFALISPFFLQWVVDNAIVSADKDLLTTLGLGFLLLMLVQSCVSAIRSWVVLYLGTTLNLQWLGNVFSHLLRLPVAYFEKRHLGDVVSRFNSINTIQHTLTTSFVEAVLDGIMALATLIMMGVYSAWLASITVCAMLLYGSLRWALYQPLRSATAEQIVQAARQQSHFLETVRGVQSIKLFGRQDERRSRWLNLVVESMNREIKTQKLAIGFHGANAVLFGAERIAIIWVGALLVLDNVFSVGMLFAFVAYKDQFAQRVSSLIDKWVEVKMLRLQGERLADIVMTAPEQEIPPAFVQQHIEPSLEVRNLSFRYADAEPFVLQKCSFVIAAGESVAIIGASGCGKTTLLKVMLGLLEPTDGTIWVGGIGIHKLGLTQYRSLVGTVMQDDQLFAGSIADNISFFDPQADHAWVEQCAKLASIDVEIVAMPMSYNTLIGDMGTALSGGQKQRILLARALYKKPTILFLDEATSHLDLAREHTVNAAIKELPLTRIIIAHRPETIRSVQRVIVLDGGTIARELRPNAGNSANSVSPMPTQAA